MSERVRVILLDSFRHGHASEHEKHLSNLLQAKMVQKNIIDGCIRKIISINPSNRNHTPILTADEIEHVCKMMTLVVENDLNLYHITTTPEIPLNICGSLFGSLGALFKIFKTVGFDPLTTRHGNDQFVFLGNLACKVNGKLSTYDQYCIELVILLFCFKIKYPSQFHLLRGRSENKWDFGPLYELCACYNQNKERVHQSIGSTFLDLPLGVLVDKEIFCTNSSGVPIQGGIKEMNEEDRRVNLQNLEFPSAVYSCLYHEPEDITGWKMAPLAVEMLFGRNISQIFMETHHLKLMVTSSKICDGFCYFHDHSFLNIYSSDCVESIQSSIVQIHRGHIKPLYLLCGNGVAAKGMQIRGGTNAGTIFSSKK